MEVIFHAEPGASKVLEKMSCFVSVGIYLMLEHLKADIVSPMLQNRHPRPGEEAQMALPQLPRPLLGQLVLSLPRQPLQSLFPLSLSSPLASPQHPAQCRAEVPAPWTVMGQGVRKDCKFLVCVLYVSVPRAGTQLVFNKCLLND